MRCERCFASVVQGEGEGRCVIEEVDDGQEALTLVVIEGESQKTYVLSEEQLAPFIGESWTTILKGIEPYETTAQEWQDLLDQQRAGDEGMPGSRD